MSNKFFQVIFFGFLLTVSANATTCSKSYTLGFFNGVWNTSSQASDSTKEIKDLVGDTYNNEPIKYETFYNHTGASVNATKLQDVAETFIQRAAEIDASGELGKRFEYFWEFIGSSEPTFIDKIKGIFSNAISLFESLYTAVNTKLVAIISYFTSNPPTEADYATHNAQLDALAVDGQKLILVGHSQGNLFMNHAYDHILPIVTKARVSAAHIAPASPTLRGDYVLANIDLVINLLRVQGFTSVPDNNLDINASRVDVSGHTLIGTYLDPTRDGRGRVKTMIEAGMGTLKCFPDWCYKDYVESSDVGATYGWSGNTRGYWLIDHYKKELFVPIPIYTPASEILSTILPLLGQFPAYPSSTPEVFYAESIQQNIQYASTDEGYSSHPDPYLSFSVFKKPFLSSPDYFIQNKIPWVKATYRTTINFENDFITNGNNTNDFVFVAFSTSFWTVEPYGFSVDHVATKLQPFGLKFHLNGF